MILRRYICLFTNLSASNAVMNLKSLYGSHLITTIYNAPNATAKTWKKKFPALLRFQRTASPAFRTAPRAAAEASTDFGRRSKDLYTIPGNRSFLRGAAGELRAKVISCPIRHPSSTWCRRPYLQERHGAL